MGWGICLLSFSAKIYSITTYVIKIESRKASLEGCAGRSPSGGGRAHSQVEKTCSPATVHQPKAEH